MKKRFYVLMCILTIVSMLDLFSYNSYAEETTQAQGTDDKSDEENADKLSSFDTSLKIDNQNIYLGMSKSYSEGYVPVVENGSLVIVLPLISDGNVKDNVITTELNLGEGSSTPFVYKNYQKNVNLTDNSVNDGTYTISSYLVSYTLELKADRINGSYPVIIKTSFSDDKGVKKEQEFKVYTTITDGKNPDEEITTEETTELVTEEPPSFAPKVLVKGAKCDKGEVKAGDEVSVEITLENTSKEKSVKNMTVNVTADDKNISLASDSETTYIDKIGAGESYIVTYKYNINPSALQGEYTLTVNMDYADMDGAIYSSSGKASVNITQETRISFDKFNISSEVELGDNIIADIQAMNMSRTTVYNVRAEIEADGLTPKGTIFIGNIEAGSSMTGSTSISVTGLSGKSSFGEVSGTVTYYYEDDMGSEYSQTEAFTTIIRSPQLNVNNSESEKKEDNTNQWWFIMAVIIIAIAMAGAAALIRFIKKKREAIGSEE